VLHTLQSAVRDRLIRAVREANADGERALAGQIEALRADLSGRLDRLDERVAHLEQRVDARIDALDGGLRGELRAWERR
jgi:uncharacterized protein YceH (UPF0502 family)